MQEIVKFLDENINGFLATLENGEPRVRAYQFILEDAGKLCFATNNTKEVCQQLFANPSMEFSAKNQQGGWIRVRGHVKFSKDAAVKEKIFARSSVIKNIYKTIDNPKFEVFYLDHGMAQIMDLPGEPIKKIEF